MRESVDLLEHWRLRLELSVSDLWWRYFALGGMRLQDEVEAILKGELTAATSDLDLLAVALNERSFELTGVHPIPYSSDPNPP